VLALEDVMRDDSRHRRGGRGGETTNGPAHAVSVAPRPLPETDWTRRMRRTGPAPWKPLSG
jgi:hypothetical protein